MYLDEFGEGSNKERGVLIGSEPSTNRRICVIILEIVAGTAAQYVQSIFNNGGRFLTAGHHSHLDLVLFVIRQLLSQSNRTLKNIRKEKEIKIALIRSCFQRFRNIRVSNKEENIHWKLKLAHRSRRLRRRSRLRLEDSGRKPLG